MVEEAQTPADRLKESSELLHLDDKDLKHSTKSSGDFKLIDNVRNVFRRKPPIDRSYQLDDIEPQATQSSYNDVQNRFFGHQRTNERHQHRSQPQTILLNNSDENSTSVSPIIKARFRQDNSNSQNQSLNNIASMQAQNFTSDQLTQPQPQLRHQSNIRRSSNRNGWINSDGK